MSLLFPHISFTIAYICAMKRSLAVTFGLTNTMKIEKYIIFTEQTLNASIVRLQGGLTYHAPEHHTTPHGPAARTHSAAGQNFTHDSPSGDRKNPSYQASEHAPYALAGRRQRGTRPAPGAYPDPGRLPSLYSENAPPGIWTPSPGAIASSGRPTRLYRRPQPFCLHAPL